MVDFTGDVAVVIPGGGSVGCGGRSLVSFSSSAAKAGILERAIDNTSLGLGMAGAFATGVRSL